MRKPIFFMLLVAMLLLAACGPAVKPATGPTTESGEVFTIALPRVIVDYDAQGNPNVEGLDLAYIDRLVGASLSSNLRIPADYAAWMTRANVQHLEMRQAGNGLNLFVNGKAMPYLAWDDASLQKTSQLAALLGLQNAQAIGRFLPVVRRLGLDLVMRFPKQAQAAEIPLVDPATVATLAAKPTGRPASALVQFEVKYDENGTPAILGVSAVDLARDGINLGATNLAPQYIQLLQSNNIQTLELRGKEDGLYVYVNGDPLPNVVWDDTFLNNAADVYGQMNDQSVRMVQVVKQLLPFANKADVNVLIHFPVGAGQKPIAARMHQ